MPDATPLTSAKRPRSRLISRNVRIGRQRTSVRLEPAVWDALEDIQRRTKKTLREITNEVGATHYRRGFTSALRMYCLNFYRNLAR